MQVKYFGGTTNDALVPGLNYKAYSDGEVKIVKNKYQKYETDIDLSYPKLMGSEMDPDDTPYTAAGFFIKMDAQKVTNDILWRC